MASIELPEEVAAVILDLIRGLDGPQSDAEIVYSFRQARFLIPHLELAFGAAQIDPAKVERAKVPLMKLGSKARQPN